MESGIRTFLSEIESLISTDPEFPLFYAMRANYYARKSLKEKVRSLEIKHLSNHSRPSLVLEIRKKIHSLTDPKQPEIQQDYIAKHYVLRDLQIAMDVIERAVNFRRGLQLPKTDLNEILKSEPSNSLEFLLRSEHIDVCFGLSQIDLILKDGEDAVALNPRNLWALYLLGVCYQRCNEHEKAITYYLQALTAYPRFVGAFSGMGNANYFLGEYSKSVKDIDSALEITNELSDTIADAEKERTYVDYTVRAGSYRKLGELQKSIECFTELIVG